MERIKPGNQRTEELNQRLFYRNIPSNQLQPQFDSRPQSSKYSKMPIVDLRVNHSTPIQDISTYNIEMTFNPGTAQAPWSGFAANINNESRLRNQFYALQKGAGQSCYIPSKNSQLYNAEIQSTLSEHQPYPALFEKDSFEEFNPCPTGLGGNFFENCTRQQLKELSQ
jgi:hypothetical protein